MTRTPALISRDPREPFTLERIDLDNPREDEILVRVQATGICHTDLITRAAGAADRPILLGHEGAGVVEAVGREVSSVRPGDQVVLTFRHCGRCHACRADRPAYCRKGFALNQFGARPDASPRVTLDGAPVRDGFFGQSSLAGYALTTADNTVVVSPGTDPVLAAPLGCGFLTGAGAVLNLLRPRPEDTVVIYGAGAVGMAGLLAARSAGVERVIVVEPAAPRRTLAVELGASTALDPADGDSTAAIRELTRGGAEFALDTTGSATVLTGAVAALATGGTVVAVGLGTGTPDISLRDIVLGGKSIRGCLEGDAVPHVFIPYLLDLHAAGRFPIDRLITARPHTEFAAALAGTAVKSVLTW